MIKRTFFLIFWVVVVVMAIYQIQSSGLLAPYWEKIPSFSDIQKNLRQKVFPKFKESVSQIKKAAPPLQKVLPPSNTVTLYLKNGAVISGDLLLENGQGVTIRWQGGDVTFARGEIDKIQKGEFYAEKEGLLFPEEHLSDWLYQNKVVIHLKDQRILDEEISAVQGEKITLRRELEEGGVIEQEIERSQIETLGFQPVRNKRSREIEESLRTQFPKMKWYREGAFTLITDSYATWVNEYRKTIRELSTDFYLTFFPLLKDREPEVAHYVVIFDDWGDYIEFAVTDGVPGWVNPGYFSPTHEVLYLINVLGDRFSSLIEEVLVAFTGEVIDTAVASAKSGVDRRYHVFIEGQAREVRKKFSAYHSYIRGKCREITMLVLRHEMTHELFHNWGLQTIVLSKIKGDQGEEAKKRRAFLDEKDAGKKRDLLFELMRFKKDYAESIQVEASNSWFTEGLAAYMEFPAAELNKERLYVFQEVRRKNAIFPIEHLTVYKLGSFPGMAMEAQLHAYSQSWAFVHFLMHRYPDQFMNYLGRMSRETPKEDEDILWLLEALGKGLRDLEEEFLVYMDQFPELEDPFLEHYDTMRRIFQAF